MGHLDIFNRSLKQFQIKAPHDICQSEIHLCVCKASLISICSMKGRDDLLHTQTPSGAPSEIDEIFLFESMVERSCRINPSFGAKVVRIRKDGGIYENEVCR
jgi:hypothetical protein